MSYLTIATAGQIGNGKDVTSKYLCEKLNSSGIKGQWTCKAFADAVKKVYMQTFNVDLEFIEKWKRMPEVPPGFGKSVRDSLIFIGDNFRSIMPTVWIDIAFRDVKCNQVISDVRYLNEAEYIRSRGGLNILMWRPGHENYIKNPSEQEIVPYINELRSRGKNLDCVMLDDKNFPFDMFLINDGCVLSLYNKLDELVIPQLLEWLEKQNG